MGNLWSSKRTSRVDSSFAAASSRDGSIDVKRVCGSRSTHAAKEPNRTKRVRPVDIENVESNFGRMQIQRAAFESPPKRARLPNWCVPARRQSKRVRLIDIENV